MSATYETTITELAPGGAGVAHVDIARERRAVFVSRTAVGDRLRLRIDDPRTRPARGIIEEILTPSADREAQVPCAVADACGGCDFIHLSQGAQRRAQLSTLRAQLKSAGIADVEVTVHEATAALGYRVRARLHVEAKAKGQWTNVVVGMHESRGRNIVDPPACVVLHPALDAARAVLRAALVGSRGVGEAWLALGSFLPPLRSGQAGAMAGGAKAEDRRAVIALTFRGELLPAFFGAIEKNVQDARIAGLITRIEGASRDMRVGAPTPWLPGADGEPLALTAFGFGPAHEDTSRGLVRHVEEIVRRVTKRGPVGDWYAGTGNLTTMLAQSWDTTACESDAVAVALLRDNLRSRGLKATVLEKSAAEAEIPVKLETLVIDTPRGGARDIMARLPPKLAHLVYVSGDSASFARDAKMLGERGFHLRSLDAYEMFPQTSHIETVALFSRGDA